MGVMVMKDLVLKNIYFQRGKGGCGGLERTDFEQFYCGRVWWTIKT